MRKSFCLFALLLLPLGLCAERVNDFVAQLMEQLTTDSEENTEEYSCITVGPEMMAKVLDLVPAEDEEHEQLQKILSRVKSMRIFSAQREGEQYYEKTIALLEKNHKSYRALRANDESETAPCVWLRKSGRKVVEMVVLHKAENLFQIINLTGNMDKQFIDEVLKI